MSNWEDIQTNKAFPLRAHETMTHCKSRSLSDLSPSLIYLSTLSCTARFFGSGEDRQSFKGLLIVLGFILEAEAQKKKSGEQEQRCHLQKWKLTRAPQLTGKEGILGSLIELLNFLATSAPASLHWTYGEEQVSAEHRLTAETLPHNAVMFLKLKSHEAPLHLPAEAPPGQEGAQPPPCTPHPHSGAPAAELHATRAWV